MVLGHSKKIYSKEESKLLIKSHSDAINKYINQVRELLKSPITIDNILKNIINNNKTLRFKSKCFLMCLNGKSKIKK